MYHPTNRNNQSGNKKNTLSHQSFKIGLEAQPQPPKQSNKTKKSFSLKKKNMAKLPPMM